MSDLTIFRNTLKDLLRPKTLIVVLLVVLLPLGIALLARSTGTAGQPVNSDVYNQLADLVIFGFVLVMLSCVFVTGLVSQEIEQKTIVYLLTRPVPRWRILLMKFLAAFVATTGATWLASAMLVLATGGFAHASTTPFSRDLLIIPIGCLAYGGLFLLMATAVRRPLILGLLYTFGIETWLPNFPGNFKMLSLMAYLRVIAPHPLTNAVDMPGSAITPHLAWLVIILEIIVTVVLSLLVFSTSEYVPRDEA